jgi:hypothetical protein
MNDGMVIVIDSYEMVGWRWMDRWVFGRIDGWFGDGWLDGWL